MVSQTSELGRRLEKVASLKKEVSSLVFFNISADHTETDFFYLTNTKAKGILIYDFKEPTLFLPEPEIGRSKKPWVKNIQPLNEKTVKEVKNLLKKKRFGINYTTTSARNVMKIRRRKDISKQMLNIRSIKTRYEISKIKKACDMTKTIFKKLRFIGTETQVLAQIENAATKMNTKGNVELSFYPVVASGPNAHIPHHEPGQTKIKGPAIIDAGVRYEGYCSDVTRTINPDKKQETLLTEIIKQVEDKIKPGVRAASIDKFVRKQMGAQAKYFTTSLGHGIGLRIHESPNISASSKDVLQPGMVFTIEPGIYIKNRSTRIENDYLLTDSGLKNLTNF